jgi:hypothetical protein
MSLLCFFSGLHLIFKVSFHKNFKIGISVSEDYQDFNEHSGESIDLSW